MFYFYTIDKTDKTGFKHPFDFVCVSVFFLVFAVIPMAAMVSFKDIVNTNLVSLLK